MFQKGRQIGPYTLDRELGRGAFGVVWLADHITQLVATQVAVKLPLPENVDEATFRKEVQIWAQVGGHPNILHLITADIFSGQTLIASHYVRGGTLLDWKRRHGGRAPSIESAIRMVIGVLQGLEHLHAKGVVHRDLKPANILLQAEEPLIADFGLARALRVESSTFRIAGTLAYMSPEVLDRNDRCVQADLWAVGVILYELIEGRQPIGGSNKDELVEAIRQSEPPSLKSVVPEVVQYTINKSLRKLKAERFESAGEMIRALSAVRWHRPPPIESIRGFLKGVESSNTSFSCAEKFSDRDLAMLRRCSAQTLSDLLGVFEFAERSLWGLVSFWRVRNHFAVFTRTAVHVVRGDEEAKIPYDALMNVDVKIEDKSTWHSHGVNRWYHIVVGDVLILEWGNSTQVEAFVAILNWVKEAFRGDSGTTLTIGK